MPKDSTYGFLFGDHHMPALQKPVHGTSHAELDPLQPGREAAEADPQGPDGGLHQMREDDELRCVVGTFPSTEDVRLCEFGNALKRNSIATLNDFLGRMLTIDVALIGGGFVAAKGEVLPLWCCVPVVVLLLGSLIACLFSLVPIRWDIDITVIEDLSNLERHTTKRKYWGLVIAGLLFLAALFVAVAGFAVKSLR